jgi:hypothetical protein
VRTSAPPGGLTEPGDVLVAIVRKRLGVELSLYQILQILSINQLEKAPISSLLEAFDSRFDLLDHSKQMILFDF